MGTRERALYSLWSFVRACALETPLEAVTRLIACVHEVLPQLQSRWELWQNQSDSDVRRDRLRVPISLEGGDTDLLHLRKLGLFGWRSGIPGSLRSVQKCKENKCPKSPKQFRYVSGGKKETLTPDSDHSQFILQSLQEMRFRSRVEVMMLPVQLSQHWAICSLLSVLQHREMFQTDGFLRWQKEKSTAESSVSNRDCSGDSLASFTQILCMETCSRYQLWAGVRAWERFLEN